MYVERPRHEVPPVLLVLLRPLFRRSVTRDAYVLRGVGNHRGPVLRPRSREPEGERRA